MVGRLLATAQALTAASGGNRAIPWGRGPMEGTMRTGSRRSFELIAVIVCVVSAIGLVPASAAATERVTDGSFEKSFCDSSDTTGCTNSSWTFGGLVDPDTTLIGPFCGEQATGTGCGAPADAPYGGSDWARLGAGEGPASITDQFVEDSSSRTSRFRPLPSRASLRPLASSFESSIARRAAVSSTSPLAVTTSSSSTTSSWATARGSRSAST